jgi:hypothetical protein
MTTPTYPSAQAPPEQGAIALPPTPDAAAAVATGSRRGRPGGDRLLTVLVLGLAFLTASFLARNSDIWFHLAAGRLLAQGQFTFGADPFAYTTALVYWANHAWLFDLVLYGLYNLVGGTGLVVLKALLVAALAGLLLGVSRPGGAAWVPVAATTLAVLAMSPRLLLQPACASYFLLGLTFWLLWRPHARQGAAGPSWLPFVFVLWVNVDEWFLLGPLLAALFWLGERLQGERRTPGWVVPAGLAACLLNPFTFHAFTLPAELSPVAWTAGLLQDVRFQPQFASPWQPAFLRAAAGGSAPALAYFALTALGLASFLVHRQALRGWRLVVWLPFALLAAWQARTIPFFAVVAAPITALNWQDVLAGRGRLAARLLLGPALLALCFLTWAGWLAGPGRDGRHVAWGLLPDPSLQQAAEALHGWRRQGRLLPDERVFAVAPEVAHYGAWFCPGEKHFFDHRYQLFPGAAGDYEAVCRALEPGLVPDRPGAEEGSRDWRQVLRGHGVGLVVFYDRDPRRVLAVLDRLGDDREHWTLLGVAGQAVIAGWKEARPPGGFAPLAFDAERLAFGPQDEATRAALPAAPEQGPEPMPSPRGFWARLSRPPAAPTWESPAAAAFLGSFDGSEARRHRQRLEADQLGLVAGLAGLPAQPAEVFAVAFELAPSAPLISTDRSPALPLLAVRAARRAVAADPEEAGAWLRLGQSYLRLSSATSEHSDEGSFPPLSQLRHTQIVTALEEALRLNPDLEDAHRELTSLYGRSNSLDLALEHRQEELRLTRRAGRRPGETEEAWADRLEQLEKDTARLERIVQDRRNRYAAGSRQMQGDRLQQAAGALRLGLPRLAAEEVLMPAPAEVLGLPGMKLELDLLLSLGRADDVRHTLAEEGVKAGKDKLPYNELPAPRGPGGAPLYSIPYHWPAYEWLQALEAAGVGDYAEAGEALRAIRAGLRVGHERLKARLRTFAPEEQLMLSGLLSGPLPFLPAYAARRLVEQRSALQAGESVLRAQQADLCVLEGLLALEQGATDDARTAFAEAERLGAPPAGPPAPYGGRAIAADYLRRLRLIRRTGSDGVIGPSRARSAAE